MRDLVLAGQLGGTAKAPPLRGSGGASGGGGTAGGADSDTVIIVYTNAAPDDALRALCTLRAHGLAHGWTHWKGDQMTLAGVYSGAVEAQGWVTDVAVSRYTAPPLEGGVTRLYCNHLAAAGADGRGATLWPASGGDMRALLRNSRALVARCAQGGVPVLMPLPLVIERKAPKRPREDAAGGDATAAAGK